MKKHFLLLAMALMTSVVSFAEDNLALNKTVKASSVSAENSAFVAANAVDGDNDSKWASDYTSDGLTDDEKSAQWFYVDLGQEKTINTVKIHTNNQAAKEFEIRLAKSINDNDVKTSGEAVSVDGATTLSAVDLSENVYRFNETQARYVIINFKKRGAWGYDICELEVYNIDYDKHVLASVTPSVKFVPVGVDTPITFDAFDQIGRKMDDNVTYSVDGTNFDGTLNVANEGVVTITAKDNSNNTATCTVYAVSANSIPTPANVAKSLYPEGDIVWYPTYNGGAKKGIEIDFGNGKKVMPFTEYANCFFGFSNAWDDLKYNAVDAGYGSFSVDVYATEACIMKLQLEGDAARIQEKKLNVGWNTIIVSLDNAKSIKNFSLRSENANTFHDVLLTNIYFTSAEKLVSATVTEAGYATFSSDKAVEFGSDVEVFTVKDGTETVTLYKVEDNKVPANNGVVIKAPKGTYNATVLTGEDNIKEFTAKINNENNNLLIADETIVGDESTIYVLNQVEGKIGFYRLLKDVKVGAGKAYLKSGTAQYAKFKAIGGGNGDGSTGISNINAAENANGAVYNLNGIRVNDSYKGIVIINGKKVIRK